MKVTKLLAFVICVFSVNLSLSQESFKHLNKADKAYYSANYKKAVKHYAKALETDTSLHILRYMGKSLLQDGDMVNAANYLEMVALDPSAIPLDYLDYAQCLKRLGAYDSAIDWFEKYREIYPLDLRARNHSLSSYHFKHLSRNSKNPYSFSLKLNDAESILGVTKYKTGVIFSMTDSNGSADFMGSPEVYLDLFYAKVNSEMEFEKVKYLPFNINSNLNDGPASYSETLLTLAFSSNKYVENAQNTLVSRLQIFFSSDESGKWSNPKAFEYNSASYSVAHPAFSPEGDKLFFISDMPGGLGGMDIYMCSLTNDGWSVPLNLGSEINTEADEVFPFVSEGGVLYFSSEGHAGLGGLDVFKSYPFEEFWTKPENIGSPVNSRYDDFGFTKFSNSQAYFISDRIGGEGQADVYYLDLNRFKEFFSVPTKLIESDLVSPITVENLKTNEKETIESSSLEDLVLDVSESGYRVSWNHLGIKKQIIITGKRNENGEYEMFLEGLEGLQVSDFVSTIELIGQPNPEEIKIDQKVWTYLSPAVRKSLSSFETQVPNYAAGADNVIFLDKNGIELVKETYPKSEPLTGKEIFFLDESKANSIIEYKETLDQFIFIYQENRGTENLAIKLVENKEADPSKMEEFGELVENYLIEKGVSPEKINLSWIENTKVLKTEELAAFFEIYITVDSEFSFLE